MRFNLISNSIKRRHNKINTHVMYLIHSSQKTKLYLKQIPNGHDEMATRGRWFLGQYSPKLTSAFDLSSAFVLRYHFFPHFRVFSRKGESGICLFHVNQCICGRCDSWSRKFWEFDRPIISKDWYHLQNTSLFHVSLLTWYREYLNTLLVLLSWKKTRMYRIIVYISLRTDKQVNLMAHGT